MRRQFVAALWVALAVFAVSAKAEEMRVITEESPPFNFTRNGHVTGSSTEVVREILKRLQMSETIEVLPWARGYKLLQGQPNIALFSTTRTPEREDQFYWIGPLFTVHYGFYARKDQGLKLNSLEDAKQVGRIATYKDDVKEQLLLSMGFTNLDSSNSPVSNLKKLMGGRVDLWLFDNLGMPDVAAQAGVDPGDLELALAFRSYQSYVAISRQTSDAVVHTWRSAFRAMVADGSFFDISRRWLPEESIPDFEAQALIVAGVPTLRIYTEDSPPGSYLENGKPEGFAVAVIREILKRLRQPDTITIVPWARGYTLARQSPNVALFSTTRLEQREAQFHWVGPLYNQTWAFYGRKNADIRVRSLDEARKVGRIGTYLMDAKAEFLKSQGFENLVSANRNSSNIQHLIRGDIDLWVSSDFNMPYLVRQVGVDPEAIRKVYAFRRVSNYIAFSLETPLTVVRQWQKCLDEMKADGTYARIARKHEIPSQP